MATVQLLWGGRPYARHTPEVPAYRRAPPGQTEREVLHHASSSSADSKPGLLLPAAAWLYGLAAYLCWYDCEVSRPEDFSDMVKSKYWRQAYFPIGRGLMNLPAKKLWRLFYLLYQVCKICCLKFALLKFFNHILHWATSDWVLFDHCFLFWVACLLVVIPLSTCLYFF